MVGIKSIPAESQRVWFYVPAAYHHFEMPAEFARHADEAHYILHVIIWRRNQERHGGSAFVQINRQILRKLIHPSIEGPLLKMLLARRVIQCNGRYRVGEKSLGYRIGNSYLGKTVRVECTAPTLKRKVLQHRISRNGAPMNLDTEQAVFGHLYRWLTRAEIDLPAALETLKAAGTTDPDSCGTTIHTIADRQFDFTVCPYGRIHTPVTRLMTECRDFLTFGGERLINVDIRNSQLVFFALLLQEHRIKHVHINNRHVQHRGRVGSGGGNGGGDGSSGGCGGDYLAKVHQSERNPSESEERFVTLVMTGQLYDYLMTLEGADGLSRRAFKASFFRDVIYGEDKAYVRETPLAKTFNAAFPSVYQFMREMKQDRTGDKPGDGYKWLAREMQRRESNLIIGGVCERLRQHHPDVPLLTIHDSIMTTPQHEDLVRRIILEEFERLGVQPTLSASSTPSIPPTAAREE